MKIDEALYQLKQNIKMHEIDGTTSNQNEREKVILNYINNLQEENNRLNNIIDKTNWWLNEMLRQAKNDETKAIINGALELLLKGDNK